MKLIIKTLKQISYEVEIDENETVEVLKKKVEVVTKNELSSSTMNLIFAGKILDNDKTLKHYKINGDRFIVAMSKSLTKTEKVDKATSPRASPNTAEDDKPERDTEQPARKVNPTDENAARSLENYSGTETITDPAKIEEVIDNISSMGYSKHEVRRAFLAACNNPERTVEYLINGCPPDLDGVNTHETPIPSPQPGDLWYIDPAELELRRERERRELNEWMRREEQQQMNMGNDLEHFEQRDAAGGTPPNTLESSRNQSSATVHQHHINNRVNLNNERRVPIMQRNNFNEIEPDNIRNLLQNIRGNRGNNPQRRYEGYDVNNRNQNNRNAGNESPFAFLRNDPRFIHMRQLIRNNPDFMRALLLDISQNNIELLEMINENQEAFVQIINENPDDVRVRPQNGQALRLNRNAAQANGNAMRVNGNAVDNGLLTLTEADRDSIERLSNLGFTEELCLEAYLACDKNEELAANYLCSQNFDNH